MKNRDKKQENEDLGVSKDAVEERSEEVEQADLTSSGQADTADSQDSELERVKKDLEQLQAKFNGLTDQLKRAVADYHNLERRVAEGRSELTTWATGELIHKILPALDNIQKAINGASEEDKRSGWFRGVEMSAKQLMQVLKEEGLDEVKADGQFDPALHEAVDTKDGNDGEILEIVEKGYRLGGKILRPARVVVGRKG